MEWLNHTNNFKALSAVLANNKFVIALLFISIFYMIKYLIVRRIKRKSKQDKRLQINVVNNIFTVLIIVMVFNIWSEEIQKFAFSIAAFIVAIVLATREFIQCFIGFVYILSSRPFRIGDWVQVGNHYGEVHSTDWAKLTLLEVNVDDYQYTGKTLYLPNSQLITSVIKNLNFLKRYAMHHFTIVRDDSVNPFEFIDELYTRASLYCSDFKEVAIRYNQLIENRLEINITGPEPHIQVATSEVGDTQIFFTIFCPTEIALEIEQKLTADFMTLWFKQKMVSSTLSN
ncbi:MULTISPECIES: mechanosensitive ion channel family protein [unclassified Colwellia]|uniref:mechanosensitive ion channel family protein n=1 Tax=unclassified Colwellia TaxID=196834 RepID=UPI0015F7056B|nr:MULTISPECIES: mechanosensitive ion channel family protein [unclassified Colwellia]MBA6357815.1 mechanosensitive ion channel family protein [Colwellia sp. BRX8-3]MBA6361609.1 mechanosensitive ion channel family protein [Colwellia sp. BRX8-6]MBA6369609.1 mechanosensitive ion channel family protein [Colwellia sp. BRX8-5]MBA6377243.1 mechanosensitive ion channel family protein [Colwellia sp. BRX8-2]MBA6384975.1 mechanosensitive ion channel family protein [Colwellia sp. BRX10-9]